VTVREQSDEQPLQQVGLPDDDAPDFSAIRSRVARASTRGGEAAALSS